VPFPGPGKKTQVSTAGGRQPRWRPDGKEIFFLAADLTTAPVAGPYQAKMMAAAVTADGTNFEVGAVQPLFDVRPVDTVGVYDVSQDGRFLVNTVEAQTGIPPLTIVVNWPALLRK
jgi:hypothetical protein